MLPCGDERLLRHVCSIGATDDRGGQAVHLGSVLLDELLERFSVAGLGAPHKVQRFSLLGLTIETPTLVNLFGNAPCSCRVQSWNWRDKRTARPSGRERHDLGQRLALDRTCAQKPCRLYRQIKDR